MRAFNMKSPTTGNPVVNQVVVAWRGKELFFSYGTLIAIRGLNYIYLNKHYYNHSATTSKYLNAFLGEKYRDCIKSGRCIVVDNIDDYIERGRKRNILEVAGGENEHIFLSS